MAIRPFRPFAGTERQQHETAAFLETPSSFDTSPKRRRRAAAALAAALFTTPVVATISAYNDPVTSNNPPASVVVDAHLDCSDHSSFALRRAIIDGGPNDNRAWSVDVRVDTDSLSGDHAPYVYGGVQYKYANDNDKTKYAYGHGKIETAGTKDYREYPPDTRINQDFMWVDPVSIRSVEFYSSPSSDVDQLIVQCSNWQENMPTQPTYHVQYTPMQ